jgi:hypothetical protein
MPGVSSELSPEEIAEVERHKYFLSEKAGYDVGWEHAEQDWRAHFRGEAEADRDEESLVLDRSVADGPLGKLIKKLLSKAAIF